MTADAYRCGLSEGRGAPQGGVLSLDQCPHSVPIGGLPHLIVAPALLVDRPLSLRLRQPEKML